VKATEVLKSEHRVVEEMLELLGLAAEKLHSDEPVNPEVFSKAVDFARNFVDKCHHAKEERHLFPELVAKGIPDKGGPVGVMLNEHELGRMHVRSMAQALATMDSDRHTATHALIMYAREYVALLKAHISKEDGILFTMADRVLPPSEQAALEHQFELVEMEEMGEGVHERYHHLIEEVRGELSGSGSMTSHEHHH